MVVVKPVAVTFAPVKATSVKAGSRYQVNTGLVTVVLLALSTAGIPAQMVLSAAMMSVTTALRVTVTVTTLAVVISLAQALVPLTVT
ncbi:hypothetical protein D3C87_1649630 [compost metagenome]